ncbi:unnamed protein product [marine sediment metagenome]|uniref:Uncharacterized protein n=1 Tax=marine sediment metagenome TaxID=412755 RepID=X1MFC1_9ZZZZ
MSEATMTRISFSPGRPPPAAAKAEEVSALPPPSKGQLNKIVKQGGTKGGISKAYICLENSTDGYEWVQLAIST